MSSMKGISSEGSADERLDDEDDDDSLYDSVCDFVAADTVGGRSFGVEGGFARDSEMIADVASIGNSRSTRLSVTGDHAILQLSNVGSSSISLSLLKEDNASLKEAVDGGERVLSRELEGEEKGGDSKLPFLLFKSARVVSAVAIVDVLFIVVIVVNIGGKFGVIVASDGRESRS